jgi:hypothetical protein
MQVHKEYSGILAVKDAESERPIPSAWRSVLAQIVEAFVRHDYQINAGIPGVAAVSAEKALHIQEYILDYGEELIGLPEETWDTSVCIWMGDRWDALIDLRTRAEGRSDLVLHVHVLEAEKGYVVDVYMVYVP